MKHSYLRPFLLILLLIFLCFFLAAPGGGGGGGGGGAGGGYGGGGFSGGHGSSDTFLFFLIMGVMAAFVIIIHALTPYHRLSYVAVILNIEPYYIQQFDQLMTQARFVTTQQRRKTLKAFCELIAEPDIADGFVLYTAHPPSKNFGSLRRNAEALYKKQMALAGLQEQKPKDVLKLRAQQPKPAGDGNVCMVAFIVDLEQGFQFPDGGREAARHAIKQFTHSPIGFAGAAFYVLYAPDPGQHVTLARAQTMLADMKREVQAEVAA